MLAKKINKELPLVVIFGRTNVGKSTLFNTLLEKKQAITSTIAGTTRDCNLGELNWRGQNFTLVDTGGLMDIKFLTNKKALAATIDELVQKQARNFLTRAALVLFVVDARDGLLPQDKIMVRELKKILPKTDRVILVANKVDSQRLAGEVDIFWQLGLGEPQPVAAASGVGTGDLLDLVVKQLKNSPLKSEEKITASEPAISVCILGQPNVGKSSLLNAILGYERVIVSPVPHTTREPQDTIFTFGNQRLKIIDTAGISKKWRQSSGLEKMGIAKSLQALERTNVAILVVDIASDLSKQEARLVEEIVERGKSLLIVANKWDLVEDRDPKIFTANIYRRLPFIQFAPIIFLSAKNRTKINHLLSLVVEVAANRHFTATGAELETFIKKCISKHPPTKGKGAIPPRIYYFEQTGTNPPQFMVRLNRGANLAESYLGFIANQLRAKYNLIGTPIKIWIKK